MSLILTSLVIIGIGTFLGVMYLIVKIFIKLRNEELSYKPKITSFEICEEYEIYKLATFSTNHKRSSHIVHSNVQPALVNGNEELEHYNPLMTFNGKIE